MYLFQALEAKYRCQKSIETALHTEILRLHHQMAMMLKPSPETSPAERELPVPTSASAAHESG